MRGLPEPMDGEAARLPRSTDDTARISRVYLDDDVIGENESAAWPGIIGPESTWRRTGQSASPQVRHPRHQAPKDDLPGPTRRELARLVRQVRALVLIGLFLTPITYALAQLMVERIR